MILKGNHSTSFTSVHVYKDKYLAFKQLSITNGMSLQKLVNRCVYLYTTDDSFKQLVDNMTALQVSGSSF
jgi:hypothetical protein